MLDFRNLTFSSSNLRAHAIMPPNSKFRLNRTIWSHLEFGNFWIFLTFPSIGSKFASAYQISSYSDDSRLRYGYITIFKNGGRPPCWIYCDVIIFCRKTEFNALDIVLNFDIHRFHTFWYTSTIMFHHFSLKLPIFALIFSIFEKYGKILNSNVVTPKRHICAWDHVFWTPAA